MKHDTIAAFRKRQGWTQKQLAELLNAALERKYTDTEIGRWENGKKPLPERVSSFLDELEIQADFPPVEGDPLPIEGTIEDDPPADDSAPPPPPGAGLGEVRGQAALPTGGGNPHLARVCEELWEMIATGVGMVGAVTGSEVLRRDGEIIHADKEALGKAWGKLAETNATFRKMLSGMTTSGAWLEVAMVSGITAGKMMRSHQAIRERQQAQALQVSGAEEEPPDGNDGSLEGLLSAA